MIFKNTNQANLSKLTEIHSGLESAFKVQSDIQVLRDEIRQNIQRFYSFEKELSDQLLSTEQINEKIQGIEQISKFSLDFQREFEKSFVSIIDNLPPTTLDKH